MNIWAKEGHRVLVSSDSSENGLEWDRDNIKTCLESGEIYEVEYTNVGSSSTDVKLKGISGLFNSVNFEDAEIQNPEEDKNHYQYGYYNE